MISFSFEKKKQKKMPKQITFRLTLVALALVAAAAANTTVPESPRYTPIVQLKNGNVRGLVVNVSIGDQKKEVQFFQAIRYGTAARFEKARPVEPWPDTYNATQQRDACPQFGMPRMDRSMESVNKSEDCLFLNLARPVEERPNPRAVMVWIHGGAFEVGSIFSRLYNGQHFASEEGVIFVSIAYRLGPLGFLSGGGVPPNLGLHDQILALKWVQENIAAFGGDPSKVTIFGESAGGMSVGALVLSPLARGLFKRAIAQSGVPLAFTDSLEQSLERTKRFAPKVNCSVDKDLQATVQCIKGKTPAELFPATLNDLASDELFRPVWGDELLPSKPSAALTTGQFNPVDFVYGVTRDEGTFFLLMFFPELAKANLTAQSAKEYIGRLMTLYGRAAHSQTIADYYIDKLQNPSQDDFKAAISAVWGDMILVCPSIIFGEELARRLPPSNRVYAYRLMQPVPENMVPGFHIPPWMGVSHGQDVFYLFMPQLLAPFREARLLSHRMVEDWAAFAGAGRPENALWKEAVNREAGRLQHHLSAL
ncbi:hypothetical protein TYRP_011940 [Tyrophagus putrescentiae]|nr:hypothetical protein TYRP_011940 [Tyrophagus putrescentiae]